MQTITKNIGLMMQQRKWSQEKLAKKSGISQRTVSNILNQTSGVSPMLSSIAKIARSFGLEFWQIALPVDELLNDSSIVLLLEYYAKANQEGRDNTLRIAKAEMRYNQVTP